MREKFDAIVIFSIYSQFGAIRKPDSGRIVCFNKGTIFGKKRWFFGKKCWHRQNEESLGTKWYIFEFLKRPPGLALNGK